MFSVLSNKYIYMEHKNKNLINSHFAFIYPHISDIY